MTLQTIFNLLLVALIIWGIVDLKVNHSVRGTCKENTVKAIIKADSLTYNVMLYKHLLEKEIMAREENQI